MSAQQKKTTPSPPPPRKHSLLIDDIRTVECGHLVAQLNIQFKYPRGTYERALSWCILLNYLPTSFKLKAGEPEPEIVDVNFLAKRWIQYLKVITYYRKLEDLYVGNIL